MIRTQIHLTKREHELIGRAATRTGRSKSEIIRAAVDQWLEQQSREGRSRVLAEVAGIWRERGDLPDFDVLRREADRITPPEQR